MKPGSVEETSEVIRSNDCLLAFGGRSKTALEAPEEITVLDMSSLSGILEYDPSEYTFSALAGTRLDEIDAMLAENGQFLPFDPPFINRGGTIGGTIASGMSGPGRYRFGGLTDFVLGVNFLNDGGRLIHSGGKVVKNAAGFDIPKLMVGSCGSFGALVEVSVKVFPRPVEYVTIQREFASLRDALDNLVNLTANPIEIYCLDLKPQKSSTKLIVRLGGIPGLFPIRIERLKQALGDIEIIQGDDEIRLWRNVREFEWLNEDTSLVKIPVTLRDVPHLEEFLGQNGCERRYSVGANIAWVAWPKPIESLDRYLKENRLSGLTILGSPGRSRIGASKAGSFYQRIKRALDPGGKWAEV